MKDYGLFERIDDKSALAGFFNSVMKSLQPWRIAVAPCGFEESMDIPLSMDETFCTLCRYEIWMHACVKRLHMIRRTLHEYFTDFHGKWKYYASYNRISCIREYGGEDEDYNEDGSVNADVPNDRLKGYSVVSRLYTDDFRDVAQDAAPSDINGLATLMVAFSGMDFIGEMRKCLGDFPIYKKEGGGMREVNKLEHSMDMVGKQITAEDNSKTMLGIAAGMALITHILKRCSFDDDNKELLHLVDELSEGLLEMDFDAVHSLTKEYKERYEDDIHEH